MEEGVGGARTIVAAALLTRGGRLLISRRRPTDTFPGLWEFPGGKLRPHESVFEALVRECREELGVEVAPIEEVRVLSHDDPGLAVELHFVRCTLVSGEPKPLQSAELVWVPPGELARYDFLPADRPLLPKLVQLLPNC